MDYPKLYSQLPKEPIKWTVSDIQIWLNFIGLSPLYDKFRELSIDGSCLNSLTQQDLREELGIKSGITIKKIMSWITKGLKQYEEFLKSPMAGASEIYYGCGQVTQKSKDFLNENPSLYKQSSLKSMPSENPNPSGPSKVTVPPVLNKVASMGAVQQNPNSIIASMPDKKLEAAGQQQDGQKVKQYQLIIQQYDGPQTSFYSVKEEGAKIGRHSSNQILIIDQSISRFHAQIKFNDGVFYLKDTGSTTGTFVKITQKVQILPEMIIQMGSNQFQAHFMQNNLTLQVIEGPSQGSIYQIMKNSKVTIGRKNTNLINFVDDQHLSNIHATIFSIDNKFYLEDMATTNGTWQRLSLEGQPSAFYELTDKLIFKFGSNQTYCCKIQTSYVNEKPIPHACIICYENDKDCVYMPCKHNTACIRCSKTLKECPICRNKIEDFVRIYKS